VHRGGSSKRTGARRPRSLRTHGRASGGLSGSGRSADMDEPVSDPELTEVAVAPLLPRSRRRACCVLSDGLIGKSGFSGLILVNFEPFILQSYSVSPSNIHAVWGEFLPLAGVTGANPQLAAMERTVERLRHEFATCLLFLQGDSPPRIAGATCASFESRYVMDQHNGNLVEYRVSVVHLIDATNADKISYAQLLSADVDDLVDVDIGVAVFFSNVALRLDQVKEAFESAESIESLRTKLHSIVTAYFGFDHDAFFTFESRDGDLVEKALRSARVRRGRDFRY